MAGSFGSWLISEADDSVRDDPKQLISLAGQIRPLIKEKITTELRKNLKEISSELANVFSQVFYGKSRADQKTAMPQLPNSKRVWEFPISSRPISVDGNSLNLGHVILGYQFPEEGGVQVTPTESKPGEQEKFLRDRAKFFIDFLRSNLLSDVTINKMSDDITYKYHLGRTAEVPTTYLWSGKITSNKGKRLLGRILVAHRIPKDDGL